MTYSSLLDIATLPKPTFFHLMGSAHRISNGFLPDKKSNKTVINLFYENSTRTMVSFELAVKRLGFHCMSLPIASSSEAKGEAFLDTLQTLAAMPIDAFVVRHRQEKLIIEAQKSLPQCGFINAGDGMRAHPSQALLDAFTIKEHFAKPQKIKIAIVGDIRHSRVANSLIEALKYLEVKDIRLCAPTYFQPKNNMDGFMVTESLAKAIDDVDVIYGLRVQKERFTESDHSSLDDYIYHYSLSSKHLCDIKSSAVIMHPGPINRGVEMTSEVADSKHSLILKQVENGVYMRMAILDWILNSHK